MTDDLTWYAAAMKQASRSVLFGLILCACSGSEGSSSGKANGNATPPGASDGGLPTGVAKARFIEENVVESADWDGSPISIQLDGVAVAINGGVRVTADPNATTITAKARLLAMAADRAPADADLTIADVKAAFVVSSNRVVCGHGGSHGSSRAEDSGCEHVDIVVPAGTDAKRLSVTMTSANGIMTLALASAVIGTITASGNGDIDADVPATKGGKIALVADLAGDITVKLPADFAADTVVLESDTVERGPFSDIAGGRGAKGTGLSSLELRSKAFAGGTGGITLSAR